MAREGEDDGDIPWDEPLELKNILNTPAVVRTNDWKDVGLELGVEKHVLDRIYKECLGQINDCKREMFSYWLKNDLQKSWGKVSLAVNTVRKREEGVREREESKVHTQLEGSKAVNAINQLKDSLEQLDVTCAKIADKQAELARDLTEHKRKWKSSQTQWKRERT